MDLHLYALLKRNLGKKLESDFNFFMQFEVEPLLEKTEELAVGVEEGLKELEESLERFEEEFYELGSDIVHILNVKIKDIDTSLRFLEIEMKRIEEASRVLESIKEQSSELGNLTKETEEKLKELKELLEEYNVSLEEIVEEFALKFEELERVVNTLEEAVELIDQFEHVGEWQEGVQYLKNNEVIHNGSTYRALVNVNNEEPSKDALSWQLIAQRGVDGDGSVSSVNGIMPDTEGNVDLGDLASKKYVDDKLGDVDLSELDEHIANKENPHGVTKSQVGLGNVANYGLATSDEASKGEVNNKYMTPLRVKEYIDANKSDHAMLSDIEKLATIKAIVDRIELHEEWFNGRQDKFGHVKLTDSIANLEGAGSSTAISPKGVYLVKEELEGNLNELKRNLNTTTQKANLAEAKADTAYSTANSASGRASDAQRDAKVALDRANQAFQLGNEVKEELVEALLSYDGSLPTDGASWENLLNILQTALKENVDVKVAFLKWFQDFITGNESLFWTFVDMTGVHMVDPLPPTDLEKREYPLEHVYTLIDFLLKDYVKMAYGQFTLKANDFPPVIYLDFIPKTFSVSFLQEQADGYAVGKVIEDMVVAVDIDAYEGRSYLGVWEIEETKNGTIALYPIINSELSYTMTIKWQAQSF